MNPTKHNIKQSPWFLYPLWACQYSNLSKIAFIVLWAAFSKGKLGYKTVSCRDLEGEVAKKRRLGPFLTWLSVSFWGQCSCWLSEQIQPSRGKGFCFLCVPREPSIFRTPNRTLNASDLHRCPSTKWSDTPWSGGKSNYLQSMRDSWCQQFLGNSTVFGVFTFSHWK